LQVSTKEVHSEKKSKTDMWVGEGGGGTKQARKIHCYRTFKIGNGRGGGGSTRGGGTKEVPCRVT